MKLNQIETLLMNNPVRSWLQRHYEAPLFERLGGSTQGLDVLEIGCGRGVGTEIVIQRFGARHVLAFDLDPRMVNRAKRRLARFTPDRVHLTVGDAAAIPAPDDAFDAVFDFGAIHHVPDWRAALSEIHRVLRPGGRLFFEEVTRQALNRWSYRTFLNHPTDDRFSGPELLAALEQARLHVSGNHLYRLFGDFIGGVACKGIHPSRALSRTGNALATDTPS